jgi:hypothetical protein
MSYAGPALTGEQNVIYEKVFAGDKIEKNEMGRACSADGGGERCV